MKNFIVALALSMFALPAAAVPDDFVTADGSLRAGVHKGKLFAVLTANDTDVVLEPDKYASDDENKAWTKWLSDFDNALFTNWSNADAGDGQLTASVVIRKDNVVVEEFGTYYPGTAGGGAEKFTAAVKAAIEKTVKEAAVMPVTKNPFKEIRYAMTFMDSAKILPFKGPEKLGFLAVVNEKGDNVTVYGRLREGQAPGIQILSDADGGNIEVTENDQFLKRCTEFGAKP